MSRRTVAYAHSMLHKALADGVQEGVLSANLASRATIPWVTATRRIDRLAVHVWDAAQVDRILTLGAGDELTTTMDLYAHVLPAQDRDAATAIGRLLGGRRG